MKAVNLIPTEQRRKTPTGDAGRSTYFVLGALAVLLAMAVAYVLTANSVNDKTTNAAEARQEADALEAKVAKLGSYTNFASIKEQRLAAVMAAAQTRFDWERMMREVSRIMPAGSWLQSTDASVDGGTADTAEAAAAAAAATAGPPSPSATFTGCTPKQSEVAKILVRMRSMHRVTDVKLDESVREQGMKDVTVDSCGPLYKFTVTATFAPATASEAPRGSNSVPASLGGGS
jgi:hypothetical protein